MKAGTIKRLASPSGLGKTERMRRHTMAQRQRRRAEKAAHHRSGIGPLQSLLKDVVRLQLAALVAAREVWGDVFAEVLRPLVPATKRGVQSGTLSSDLDELIRRYAALAKRAVEPTLARRRQVSSKGRRR